jgi:hypothetical protein
MSDAYRDDHEAALARIDALEDELSRERAGDFAQEQRIAQLEAQLARAKEQVRQAEDAGFRLEKPPVSTRPRQRAVPVEIEDPAPRAPGDRGVAIFVSVLLLAIVAVGLVLIATTHTPQPAASSPAGQAPPR